MDLDTIVKMMESYVGRSAVLGLWEFNSLDKGGISGFYFKTMFKIKGVVKDNERIRVSVCIELFDSWKLFEQSAERIFISIVKGQLTDQIHGVEDLLDVVIVENEGVKE